ncbi:hypothetical protein OU792_15100 [Algoriphagus sp. NF]|uniref:hypothetical protein n=1 Tax=Algoriphagus sp. NF TaxID=2992756 RepID=UPI00237A0BBA|nr:hypothetical protein [Algoriphagus sp. NF]MDE0561325.1 hypothetical protein [Algoriphagus sp. NF]
MTKFEKIKILDSYFQKTISKEDLKFLFEKGTAIPPIPWIKSNEEEQKEDDRKRELIENVFGVKLPKIEWIRT